MDSEWQFSNRGGLETGSIKGDNSLGETDNSEESAAEETPGGWDCIPTRSGDALQWKSVLWIWYNYLFIIHIIVLDKCTWNYIFNYRNIWNFLQYQDKAIVLPSNIPQSPRELSLKIYSDEHDRKKKHINWGTLLLWDFLLQPCCLPPKFWCSRILQNFLLFFKRQDLLYNWGENEDKDKNS